MKTSQLLLLLLLPCTLNAQLTQKGTVREMNSGKKPLPGVSVQFFKATSTDSDNAGKFTLTFTRDKTSGDAISLLEVRKNGYELVNETDLQGLRLSNDGILPKDIILAKKGVIEVAKAEYAGVSLISLTAGYERERKALITKVNDSRIKEAEYNEEIKALSEAFEIQKIKLDALAATFARVNFDDVSEAYKEALELYKAGKLTEAIAKLEGQNLAKQTQDILIEIKRITDAEAKLEDDKRRLAEKKKQHIEMLSSLADMHNVNFNPQRAEGLMDTLLLLDSTDLDILQKAADFYREQHRYQKAKQLYPKIINHPTAEAWQLANAYGSLGGLFTTTGDLEEALANYKQCYSSYLSLYTTDSSSFHKNGLAINCQYLAITHQSLGNVDKALILYESYNSLEKELNRGFPNNITFKNNLASSYERLGSIQETLGNYDKALYLHQEFQKLIKELSNEYPNDIQYKLGVAISYEKLGSVYSSLKNLEKALEYHQIGVTTSENLLKEYPKNIEVKHSLAVAYEKLGKTHRSLGNMERALVFHEFETALFEELINEFPSNVVFKNGIAVSYQYMGEIFNSNGVTDKAFACYQLYNAIEKELNVKYPANSDFRSNLANSYLKLGNLYRSNGNLIEALACYQNQLDILKEFYQAHPNNKSFKNRLAISYEKLGITHSLLENLNEALIFYQSYNSFAKELNESFPTDIEYKNNLAISYAKLGMSYLDQDKGKSLSYLKDALQQFKELINMSPQNIDFKRYYDTLYSGIREIEASSYESESILKAIQNSKVNEERFKLYKQLLTTYQEEGASSEVLASTLNSVAWYGLLSGQFNQILPFLEVGIYLDPEYKYFYTNLPPTLLFQGRVDEAMNEYKKWALQPFGEQGLATYKDAFLADFEEFEAAGIIPEERKADVARVKKLLQEMN